MIQEYINHLNEAIAVTLQIRLLVTAGTILFFWIIAKLLTELLHFRMKNMETFYKIKKSINYFFSILNLLLIGFLWIDQFKYMSTFLGLFSAGLAISLKDIISNIAGWMFLLWRKPFSVGDRIQIGTTAGDVIDIRLFHFTLMEIGNWVEDEQSTGRVVHIPNHKIITEPLANYGMGFQYIWNEISVLLTFESNWKKAKLILRKVAEKHAEHLSVEAEQKVRQAARRYMIMYNHLTPIVYVSVKDSGIQLTMRYLCEPRRRRITIDEIWEDILQEFEFYNDISFAYNTQRIVMDEPLEMKMERTVIPENKKK